ncbi:hypothetical protein [Flindersiella endophytica]
MAATNSGRGATATWQRDAGQGQSSPGGQSGGASSAGAAEAPPWAGTQDAAAWQTPPDFAPRRTVSGSQPASPGGGGSSTGAGTGAGLPVEPAMRQIPQEPVREPSAYPAGLGMLASLALVLAAVSSAAYGVLCLTQRRAIFSDLAKDAGSVSTDSATTSDTINLVLFLTASVLVIAAAVLVGLWMARVFQALPQARLPFGVAWWVAVGLATVLIVVAFFLHAGDDLNQIVVGYILLGVGSVLVAALSVIAILGIRGVSKNVEELTSAPVPKRLV